MASTAHRFDDKEVVSLGIPGRLYTACFFDGNLIVPRVQLFEATTDEHAITQVRSSHTFTKREIWDRHRLVAVIPPGTDEITSASPDLENSDASERQG